MESSVPVLVRVSRIQLIFLGIVGDLQNVLTYRSPRDREKALGGEVALSMTFHK